MNSEQENNFFLKYNGFSKFWSDGANILQYLLTGMAWALPAEKRLCGIQIIMFSP
ncbi:hypothetical protein HMPREF3156_01385 [Neisseria sp. HMSC06F02]|jgi:hypothetical protein|nr:hypothetical protein HMPREF3156_01385 [Neisseria sp. HMSC06F02]